MATEMPGWVSRKIIGIFLIIFSFVVLPAVPGDAVAETISGEAEFTPWSGYWWPYTDGALATGRFYYDSPSPTEKYDQFTTGNYPGSVTSWVSKRYYQPHAPYWYGLCFNWAMASIQENFEILPSTVNNMFFRVGDKKGLLTLLHDDDLVYSENGADPSVFHYWLLHYIGEKKQAFVADLTPGAEVWSYPIYRYEMDISRGPGKEMVTTTIYYADDFVEPDFIGTQVQKSVYKYELDLQGDTVVGGKWLSFSENNHPERLAVPLQAGKECPDLEYDIVRYIAQTRDDELEFPEPTEMAPGTHHLILMDEDRYLIDCDAGDGIHLDIEKVEGSEFDFSFRIEDQNGLEIKAGIISNENPVSLQFEANSPPYTLSFSQTDYSDPNFYRVLLDVKQRFSADFPVVPRSWEWCGIAVTNTSEKAASRVKIATYSEDGQPIQTLYEEDVLPAKGKFLRIFGQLPWREHEYKLADMIRVSADSDVQALFLSGQEDRRLLGALYPEPENGEGGPTVVPYLQSRYNYNGLSFFELMNPDFGEVTGDIQVFSSEGGNAQNETTTLSPQRGKGTFQAGERPFLDFPDGGWCRVFPDEGRSVRSLTVTKADGLAEAVFSLEGSREKFISHITPFQGLWKTEITLINLSSTENSLVFFHNGPDGPSEHPLVTLGPNEKAVFDMGEWASQNGLGRISRPSKIRAEFDFAGFVSFSSPQSGSDEAFLPLFENDDFGQILTVPHVAGNGGYWWTRVCLFNPNDDSVRVALTGYKDGQAYLEREFFMEGSSTVIDSVGGLFGEINVALDFFEIEVKSGLPIGGFFLFGNQEGKSLRTDMVAGFKMPKNGQ